MYKAMKKKLNFWMMCLAIICCASCHNYKEKSIGPNIGIASKEFSVTTSFTASTGSVNFNTGPNPTFAAQFNEKVSFTITIKGTVSGATKTIRGLSDQINASNSLWDGTSDFIFFSAEPCIAELTVLGKDEVIGSDSIVITAPRKGTFVANFENFSLTAGVGFWEANEKIYCGKSDTAFEGLKGYKMEGVDTKGGGFIGLSYVQPTTITNAYYNKNGFSLGAGKVYYGYNGLSDPDSLWFNIFIYGTGDPHAMMYVKFKQDDNTDGSYSDPTENGFEWQVMDISHTGWKRYSVNYSTIMVSGNQAYGGGGDQVHRPNRIQSIELALWSKQKNGQVSIIYDYPVFTYGKPFGE